MVVLGRQLVKHAVAGTQSVVSAIGHQLPGVDAYAAALSWRAQYYHAMTRSTPRNVGSAPQVQRTQTHEGSEEDTDHDAERKEGGEAVQEGGQTGDFCHRSCIKE
jgi:hypothetical protein